ncbi:MarR family winged helix-turn-helix transcriptional regulator [uncultured Jatrophihabitans sp.]|uniref:MarR family winged helix-turn-helix transcriptional regulator n=1 Tax=uncultured Jatrophihabitans sp. TaxID=1610747 RepID=UPI0035CC5969
MTSRGRLATAHAEAGDSAGLLMWQVTNRWQSAVRAELRPFELTHVQFVLLASLTWLNSVDEGPVTQVRLAQHAATDPMMTSQVARALAGRGLVERRAHPDDGRAVALHATAVGVELVNRAFVAVEACDRQFFAALGREQDTFVRQLRTLLAQS